MRYLSAFLLKFVLTTAIVWIVFGLFYGGNFRDIITIGVLLSAIAFVGDTVLLPRIGNIMGVIGDFILAFFVIWLLGNALLRLNIPIVTTALISAFLISIGEIFFHRYMKKQVFAGLERDFIRTHQLQTEYSEEIDPKDKRDNEK